MPKTSKQLTISIVIPVYNEAEHLHACLESIVAQSVAPDEVIVIDNNSTDGSAEIAKSFDFVTLMHEPLQGIIPARNLGFDVAKSDIIGRIDADVILSRNWVKTVKHNFSKNSIAGLTGFIETDALLHTHRFRTTFWSRMYQMLSNPYFRVPVMFGGNMAILREAWLEIKADTCLDSSYVHEDQDLSLVLAGNGYKIVQDSQLIVALPLGSTSHHNWPKLKEYIIRRERTKNYHVSLGTLQKPGAYIFPLGKGALLAGIMLAPFMLFAGTSFVIGGFKRLKYEYDIREQL